MFKPILLRCLCCSCFGYEMWVNWDHDFQGWKQEHTWNIFIGIFDFRAMAPSWFQKISSVCLLFGTHFKSNNIKHINRTTQTFPKNPKKTRRPINCQTYTTMIEYLHKRLNVSSKFMTWKNQQLRTQHDRDRWIGHLGSFFIFPNVLQLVAHGLDKKCQKWKGRVSL